MKPFNLEEALAGKPVVTRDGRPVKIGGYNPDGCLSVKLIGWVGKNFCSWLPDGTSSCFPVDSCLDLFMASEKKKGWVNIYPGRSNWMGIAHIFETEALAMNNKAEGCIATVRIEWEE